MKVITPASMSKTAAAEWKRQYFDKENGWGEFLLADGTKPEDRYRKALAAGRSKRNRVAEVTEALNESWTRPFCGECRDYVDRAILLDLFEDQEAILCESCLAAAIRRLK